MSEPAGNLRTVTNTQISTLAQSLEEDVATRWVPDVIADADLCVTERPRRWLLTADDALRVEVPKRSGTSRTVWQLSGRALANLHEETAALRRVSDSLLHPHVCGYRSGAEAGSTYSDEYQRYRRLSAALAAESRFVLSTDVSRFFSDLDFDLLAPVMQGLVGHTAWSNVERLFIGLRHIGVEKLPAGYADARLIANLALTVVDAVIPHEFTRWVDDYRIFLNDESEADAAVDLIDRTLASLGLSRSREKTRLESVEEFTSRRLGRPLDSVYHPQDDSVEQTCSALRTVLIDGLANNDRRLVRFALPRMREMNDDFGVPLVIQWLLNDSTDAPRIVDYLSAFVNQDGVRIGLERILAMSDAWTLARIAPLFASFMPSDSAWDEIDRIVGDTALPVATRGLFVRISAIHGVMRRSIVDLESDWLPTRTAVAALLDLGDAEGARAVSGTSGHFECLGGLEELPVPSARSIL
jgi:Reverse transcriptase (RNA-dependent DNA polymerase)